MSNNFKLISLLIAIVAVSVAIVVVSLNTDSVGENDISLTAEAYYLNYNEIAGTTESSYVEKEDAKAIGSSLSGSYKGKKMVESLDEYKKDYLIAVSSVYIGRSVSEIDSYSKDPVPDEEANAIYGEVIYIFDKKTISFYDPEDGKYWIGKKKDGSIDLDALGELIKNNQVVEEEVEVVEEEPAAEEEATGEMLNEGVPGFNEDPED